MSIRFLDDTDLVEQDRDQIHRILYSADGGDTRHSVGGASTESASNPETKFPLTNEFPYPNAPIFPYDGIAEALVSPVSGDAQSVSSEVASSAQQSPSQTPTGHEQQLEDENDVVDDQQQMAAASMYQQHQWTQQMMQQQQQQQQPFLDPQQQQQLMYDQMIRQKELSPSSVSSSTTSTELNRSDYVLPNLGNRLPPPAQQNFAQMPHGMQHMGYQLPPTMTIRANQGTSPYALPGPAAGAYPTAYLQQQQGFQPTTRPQIMVYNHPQMMGMGYFHPAAAMYAAQMPPLYRQRLLLPQQQLFTQAQMSQPPPSMQHQHSMQQPMYNQQQQHIAVAEEQEQSVAEDEESASSNAYVYESSSRSEEQEEIVNRPMQPTRTIPTSVPDSPELSGTPVQYVDEDQAVVDDVAGVPSSVNEFSFGNFDDIEQSQLTGDERTTGSSQREEGYSEQNRSQQDSDQVITTGMPDSSEQSDLQQDMVAHDDSNVPAPTKADEAAISASAASTDTVETTAQEKDDSAANAESTEGAAPATKSWASLFKRGPYQGIVVNTDQTFPSDRADDWPTPGVSASAGKLRQSQPPTSYKKTVVAPEHDDKAQQLKDLLKMLSIVHKGPTFQPRGLHNGGNWCYMNSVLQALVACPPFFHLMRLFGNTADRVSTCTPILDALSLFVAEFVIDQNKQHRNRLDYDLPMTADCVQEMVARLKSDAAYKGRQEDAEELLLALLNGLHEEMIAVMEMDSAESTDASEPHGAALTNGHSLDGAHGVDAEPEEWQQVMPGKKHPITRKTVTTETPLSQIFMGHVRYSIHRQGAKDSANVEPFFTLPLEIQSHEVVDVPSALSHSLRKETVKGSTSSSACGKITKEVDVLRRGSLDDLPPVLILQLKYFVYTPEGGVKKLLKPIHFSTELNIDREVLSQFSNAKISPRKYKLFAVVLHHGEKAQGGHYTTRVFHAGYWLEMDDALISSIPADKVTVCQSPVVPYLLFYRRCDLMQQS